VLDLQTGVLECTLGGHNPPVLFGPSAPASFAKLSPELIVGALDGIHFDTQRIELVPGSGLLLYTDGISEAETGDYKEYSEQKLLDTVDAVRDGTSRELCMHVLESVRTHADGAEQSDDMTLLALRYHGH
jgi:sigma-B regulation protein RsbU (phosphoserine phosphatase)